MKVTVVAGDRLTNQHLALWEEVLRANTRLDSPFFRPEYVQAASAARNDVSVGIVETEAGVAGFFPFQCGRRNIGQPVGRPLSDFQAAIISSATELDARAMVRGCGLAGWNFDHLLAEQQPFHGYHRVTVPSPFMDLSRGFEAYEEGLRDGARKRFSGIRQMKRVAGRRVGPVRFELHSTDNRVFNRLIEWKTAQYNRTNTFNVFGLPWVMTLLERIRDSQDGAFSGILSALYFGDRLAAVHFGMRSRNVLHYWFPAYDTDLARYSPGLICLLEMAREGALTGILRIDLGKGSEQYKQRLMSGAINVSEGEVLVDPFMRMLGTVKGGAIALSRVPIIGGPVRWIAAMGRSRHG